MSNAVHSAIVNERQTPLLTRENSQILCPKCSGEVRPSDAVICAGLSWHSTCFTCGGKGEHGGCMVLLSRSSRYTIRAGMPYCRKCTKELNLSIHFTGGSHEATHDSTADCIPTKNQVASARKDVVIATAGVRVSQLTSNFSSPNGKAGSVPAGTFVASFDKVNECPLCNKIVYKMEEVIGVGAAWHKMCFMCGGKGELGCKRILTADNYIQHRGIPYCEACFNKNFRQGVGLKIEHARPRRRPSKKKSRQEMIRPDGSVVTNSPGSADSTPVNPWKPTNPQDTMSPEPSAHIPERHPKFPSRFSSSQSTPVVEFVRRKILEEVSSPSVESHVNVDLNNADEDSEDEESDEDTEASDKSIVEEPVGEVDDATDVAVEPSEKEQNLSINDLPVSEAAENEVVVDIPIIESLVLDTESHIKPVATEEETSVDTPPIETEDSAVELSDITVPVEDDDGAVDPAVPAEGPAIGENDLVTECLVAHVNVPSLPLGSMIGSEIKVENKEEGAQRTIVDEGISTGLDGDQDEDLDEGTSDEANEETDCVKNVEVAPTTLVGDESKNCDVSSDISDSVATEDRVLDDDECDLDMTKCTVIDITAFGTSFDKQGGVIKHLATAGGTRSFTNPHSAGLVHVTMSSIYNGSEETIVDYDNPEMPNYTYNTPLSYVEIDLGRGRRLVPTRYCMMHGGRYSGNALRNWILQGRSRRGEQWHTVREHKDDCKLWHQPLACASWRITVPPSHEKYITAESHSRRSSLAALAFSWPAKHLGHMTIPGLPKKRPSAPGLDHSATIDTPRGDSASANSEELGPWPEGPGFRYFRIVQTGPNSGNNDCLFLGCIEFYGVLTDAGSTSDRRLSKQGSREG